MPDLHFLFLQGLPSPFFSRVAQQLSALGCGVTGINLCVGDSLFWRGANTLDYRGKPADWPDYIADVLERNRVTDILLLGEQRSYHQQAIAAAKARNIRVIVIDFGYLRPDWITFELDGMSGNSKFPKEAEAILALAQGMPKVDLEKRYADSFFKMAIGDMLYHFANLFFGWLFPHYRRPYKRDHPFLHYPAIGKRLLFAKCGHRQAMQRLAVLQAEKVRYFLFPLQLENDFQIIAYSPFNSFDEAIQLILNSFANHADADTRLLIKVHPLEPGLKNWRKLIYRWGEALGISRRLDFFDGGNLDEIICSSVGMVTVNSTAGIRALQLGSPVITLGEAIYNISGLTQQSTLDDFWQAPQQPDAKLVDAFIRSMAGTIQIRGVFYNEPGLSAAVNQAVERLYRGKVGLPWPDLPSGLPAESP